MLFLRNVFSILLLATMAAAVTNILLPLRGNQLTGWFAHLNETEAPRIYNPGNLTFDNQCDGLQLFGQGVPGFLTLAGFCTDSNKTMYFTELNLNGCLENDNGQLHYTQESLYYMDSSCSNFGLYQDANSSVYLAAGCTTQNQTRVASFVKLGGNETGAVRVKDGQFVCGNTTGTLLRIGVRRAWTRK